MAQNGNHLPLEFIAGADDFGCSLKDAIVSHLRSLGHKVNDIGTGAYYSIGEEVGSRVAAAVSDESAATRTIGLVSCGTGVGVQIFANKFPGVYAATCSSADDARSARSINNANVLAVSGLYTTPETAVEIVKTFIETPFKAPCNASGGKDWDPEIQTFLDNSLPAMAKIGASKSDVNSGSGSEVENCALCCLAKNMDFTPVEIMPGSLIKIVRESPTSAMVKFKAGSVEPAHHHTFGHDLVVLKGRKRVWNLSKEQKYDLEAGDYLFTPAGDVHRVKYFEDTEFFITWDGKMDIFLDEDIETAKAAIDKEL